MREGRILTLRGQIRDNESPVYIKRNLMLDDGRLGVGYKVKEFWCFPQTYDINTSYHATLSTDSIPVAQEINAADNRQIGWIIYNPYTNFERGILDPEHIVQRELRINVKRGQDYLRFNYLIVLQEVFLTDDESIMTLIKQDAQDILED
jgi:hypothetical protein